MPDLLPNSMASPPHRLRSGTAARLAGLPVTTLRVWERRYDVTAAGRTSSGQRFYSLDDVARLRLLRRLTQDGHAIGTIAALDLDSLRSLAEGIAVPDGRPASGSLDAVVVGRSAAQALEAVPDCVLRAVHDNLVDAESAAAAAPESGVGLLLVRLASLQPPDVERVLALGAQLDAGAVLVVYAFGTEASERALIEAGVTVRREPLTGRRLAHWVRAARASVFAVPAAGQAAARVQPRRFDDDALSRLARMPSTVACECMRHVAEIVAQLAGFERYSEECTSTQPADSKLHRELNRTAGVARTMFEDALQRIVDEVGLEP